MNEELEALKKAGVYNSPQVTVQLAILEQLEELNATLLKLAENVTSCTYVYRGEPVVRTDPIR